MDLDEGPEGALTCLSSARPRLLSNMSSSRAAVKSTLPGLFADPALRPRFHYVRPLSQDDSDFAGACSDASFTRKDSSILQTSLKLNILLSKKIKLTSKRAVGSAPFQKDPVAREIPQSPLSLDYQVDLPSVSRLHMTDSVSSSPQSPLEKEQKKKFNLKDLIPEDGSSSNYNSNFKNQGLRNHLNSATKPKLILFGSYEVT